MLLELHIDNYIGGAVVIISAVIISSAGQIIVHKLLGREQVRECHEVGGNYMQLVGTLYAVMLALVVVDAMNKFQSAKEYAENEATGLITAYIMATKMPGDTGITLKRHIEKYIDEVIDNEWRLMRDGRKSELARSIFLDIFKVTSEIEPVTENQKTLFGSIVSNLDTSFENRRARLNFAEFQIPTIEWVVLIIGGVVVIFFTYFFSMRQLRVQFILTGLITLMITMNLYLVQLFGEPYAGDLCVTSYSFGLVRDFVKANP